jgi:hypothetical protein
MFNPSSLSRCWFLLAAVLPVAGCTLNIASSGGDDGQGNRALNDNIAWPSNAYALDAPPTDDSITITPPSAPASTPAVMEGDAMSVSVPFSTPNANVVGVGIRFGDSGPIMTIPTSTMGKTSGTLSANVTIPPSICKMLSSICHNIKCYEYAVTSIGKVSRANIRSLALMCGDCSQPSCKDLLPDMCFDPGNATCVDGSSCPSEGSSAVWRSCASVSGSCASGYYITSSGRRFDCGSCSTVCSTAAQALTNYCGL